MNIQFIIQQYFHDIDFNQFFSFILILIFILSQIFLLLLKVDEFIIDYWWFFSIQNSLLKKFLSGELTEKSDKYHLQFTI